MELRAPREEIWMRDMIRNSGGRFGGLEMVGERQKRKRCSGVWERLFQPVRWLKSVENRLQIEEGEV
jgi:hypothetical protein